MFVFFIAIVCATLGQAAGQDHTLTGRSGQPVITYLNTVPGVGYVGSKACAGCHRSIYEEYRRTAMGRSMSIPGKSSQPLVPKDGVTVYEGTSHRYYQIFWKDSKLFQSEYETGPDGRNVFKDTQQISYLMGAGENGISYLVHKGGYLFEAPLSYYTQLHSWALSPGFDLGDYGFHRPVLAGCAICHSGRSDPVPNRPGLYKVPAFTELSIGCENCHGPGQLHVEQRMRGLPLKARMDPSIVNPDDLSGWLADNICMMCHQVGDARVLQPGKTYLDFRPGAPLDRTVAIFAVPFTQASPPRDPLLQHQALMTLSKCYLGSRGKLKCITCHDPHYEPPESEAAAYYRSKCLTCHTEKSCALPLAQRQNQTPPDDCIACHMPRQGLQRISHSALTNHRIVAYAGEPFPQAAFHQTTPSLPDLVHVDAVPGATAGKIPALVLLQAYGTLMASHPEYRARYEEELDKASADLPQNPFVRRGLARRDAARGTTQAFAAARRLLKENIAAGSATSEDYELYGYLLAQEGESAAAISILKQGIERYPYSTRLYKRLALTYARFHQYQKGLATMRQELQMFPEDSSMRKIINQVQVGGSVP